ncbi:EAL domain-containing protein [Pseudomonas putida]
MRRRTIRKLAAVTGAGVFVAGIVLSAALAVHHGRDEAREVLNSLTADVIHRSVSTQAQVDQIVNAQRSAGLAPCSPDHLALMQRLLLESSYLQGLAYIQGNQLLCSTVPVPTGGIDLGAPDHVTVRSGRRWTHLTLPAIPDTTFVVNEHEGYAAIIVPSLVLDVGAGQTDIAITHFRNSDASIVRTRGEFKAAWLAQYHQQPTSFFDDGMLVFIQPSTDNDSSVVAAMPEGRVAQLVFANLPGYLLAGGVIGLMLGAGLYIGVRQRLSFKAQLLRALKRREFFLLYQPVMNLRTGECVGAEALIRWNQPEKGFISPVVFIPAAEANGLIQKITAQVMEMVAEDSVQLIKDHPDTHIAINFSAEDLHSVETEQRLQDLIGAAGGTSDNILIEATERGLMVPDKAKEVLVSIRAKGFKVAIDDFGTGNSSLSYLSTYDLDYLKIDKAFVDEISNDRASSPLLFHIIEIARSLGLKMIAEGVEHEHQRNVLRDAGVQMAQGWYFGKPMPISDLRAFIYRCKEQAQATANADS